MKRFVFAATLAGMLLFDIPISKACTRVVYKGADSLFLTARSMDWNGEIGTNLWIFPRGMHRQGTTAANALRWKSKYGSLIASVSDFAAADGMNEKGLVANLLWFSESDYGTPTPESPTLSISLWVQYFLDNFATVEEAVQALSGEPFKLQTIVFPGKGYAAKVHLSLSDAHGDNAVLEYLDGQLHIHHDPSFVVMTNDPRFEEQMALNAYWQSIGGKVMLPGSDRDTDRFVRAWYYTHALPRVSDTRAGVATAFSILRNCSVPFGISTSKEPNTSGTLWRVVADQRNRIYYFESALTLSTCWIDLTQVDFSEEAPVRKLSLAGNETYNGDATTYCKVCNPFRFLGA